MGLRRCKGVAIFARVLTFMLMVGRVVLPEHQVPQALFLPQVFKQDCVLRNPVAVNSKQVAVFQGHEKILSLLKELDLTDARRFDALPIAEHLKRHGEALLFWIALKLVAVIVAPLKTVLSITAELYSGS